MFRKMSKNLSAKYYQENKKRIEKKKFLKDIKIFLKKKKKQYSLNVEKIKL